MLNFTRFCDKIQTVSTDTREAKMGKSSIQKVKLLYLLDIMMKYTDEEHPKTVYELIELLAQCGIPAERKSIYDDIERLVDYGADIVCVSGKSNKYYVASRKFEIPELKLLVDAIQSSKFITRKKSEELIGKLEELASVHQARSLQRQVYVANRVKTVNEKIYYTVDYIHSAILADSKISFKYFEWTPEKKKVARHGGKDYVLSPWALTWDDENYYLVAFDSHDHIIKHFRVDKIEGICVLDEKREGHDEFESFDMAIYSRRVFGMFGGREEYVSLVCDNTLAGIIIDRFGSDVPFIKKDEGHFEISVSVVLSPQFYSWVFGLSDKIRIVSPPHAVEGFKNQLKETAKLYE